MKLPGSPFKGCHRPCWVAIFTLASLVAITLQQDGPCSDAGDYCKTLRPDECYHNEEFCCKSCKKFSTDNTGCKFGDKASVCSEEYCLFSWNLELCCHTCRNNLTTTTRSTTLETTTRRITVTVPVVTNTSTSTTQSTAVTRPCQDGIINGVPCKKYIQNNGKHFCYRYEEVCCDTCSKIRNKNNADCPYGDKLQWCQKLSRDQCYANNATCCEKCESLRTNIAGCQYGDSMPYYCSTFLRQDCYEEEALCCATCRQYLQPGAPSGCQYGDRMEAKKCSKYKRNGQCQELDISKQCCRTCSQPDDIGDYYDYFDSSRY